MARLASLARACYYPTPEPVAAACADLVRVGDVGSYYASRNIVVMDPCAGNGDFVGPFVSAFKDPQGDRYPTRVLVAELDHGRFARLELEPVVRDNGIAIRGDSWRITNPSTAGILLLNPPYDNRVLEASWTEKWHQAVAYGGVMVLVIPVYSLAHVAERVAQSFESVRVVRFPDQYFPEFQQVIVVGRRVYDRPDPDTENELRAMSKDSTLLPVLGRDPVEPVELESRGGVTWGSLKWEIGVIDKDLAGSEAPAWSRVGRKNRVSPIAGTLGEYRDLDDVVSDFAAPRVRTVLPPPAAHVSVALAAGIVDGAVIVPDGGSLPPVAVRGTYSRQWVPIELKKNRDGGITGQVEQQVPVLTIGVVDLETGAVRELIQSVELGYSPERFAALRADPDAWEQCPEYRQEPLESPLQLMSAGDLLAWYGTSIRETISARCVPVFNPATDTEPVPGSDEFVRTPYPAQSWAIQAVLRLLRRGPRGALVAGETGSGKTTIATQAAVSHCIATGTGTTISRILVTAPSHLVYEWVANQVPMIVGPGVEIVELGSVSDVENWVRDDRSFAGTGISGSMVSIGVVSRSVAKLGYPISGVTGSRCPDCGAKIPEEMTPKKLASTRYRCEAPRTVVAGNDVGAAALNLFRVAAHVVPDHTALRAWAPRRAATKPGLGAALVNTIPLVAGLPMGECTQTALLMLLHCLDDATLDVCAGALFAASLPTDVYDDEGDDIATHQSSVLGIVLDAAATRWGRDSDWVKARLLDADTVGLALGDQITVEPNQRIRGCLPNTVPALRAAVSALAEEAVFVTRECGAPLFTADVSAGSGYRRVPLMKYIHRRYRKRIDFAIADECHEAANPNSAQSQSDQLLYKLGCPFIEMSGTMSNGFARSLHVALYYTSPGYSDQYGHGGSEAFQRDHGYNVQVRESVDVDGRTVEYGAMSAARTRTRALSRSAPGISPGAVARYFLPVTVPIALGDLGIGLPPCTERTITVEPDPDQRQEYERALVTVKSRIQSDRWTDRSGVLLGALAQVGSMLDRNTTDVGNCEDGGYEVRYSEKFDSELVFRSPGISGTRTLPKEAALLEYVQDCLRAGDRTIVGVWYVRSGAEHTLATRLVSLMAGAGIHAVYLDSQRVTPKKRIRWIDQHVLSPGADVLIVNPRAVETGINNLTYFSRIASLDGYGSNPKTYDQFAGRINRPGQTRPTEITTFLYNNTVQVLAHEHLMRKVAVVRATDGGDPREALRAVGAGGSTSVDYSMTLAEMILRAA